MNCLKKPLISMPGSSLTCQSNVGRPVTFTGFHGHMITFTPVVEDLHLCITGAANVHVPANANTTMDTIAWASPSVTSGGVCFSIELITDHRSPI